MCPPLRRIGPDDDNHGRSFAGPGLDPQDVFHDERGIGWAVLNLYVVALSGYPR
jgi:hypothetical protein